ncbi:MAG: uracil-DNA glycosylase family protein [Acidimicrobiia bacterium]
MDALFDGAVQEIKRAYKSLGHTLGYRFLFSSRSTLSAGTKLMLVGVAPAGDRSYPSTVSHENGNAFWRDVDLLHSKTYAIRVCRLFEDLAPALEEDRWQDLMDRTLTSNFCPFRSSTGLPEHNKGKTVDFCRKLWQRLRGELRPRALICLGKHPYKEFRRVYEQLGFVGDGRQPIDIDTGKKEKFEFETFRHATHELTIFYVPHPSRGLRIFGNPEYSEGTQRFVGEVRAALGGR